MQTNPTNTAEIFGEARAGFRYPTACTASVWGLIDALPDDGRDMLPGIVHDQRLAEVLRAMLDAIRRAAGTDRVEFEALGSACWAHCGPGDAGEPVITLMQQGED